MATSSSAMTRRGWRGQAARALAGTLGCAVLAACGSTVSGAGQPVAGGNAPGVQSSGAATDGLGTTGGAVPAAPSLRGTGGPALSAYTEPGAAQGGSSADPRRGPRRTSTGTPFTVGIPFSTTDQAALAAIGAKGSVGNLQKEAKAVIAWLNARGGVGGRTIVPSWLDENAAEPSNQVAQDACNKWVHDDHVDAAIPGGPNVDMDPLRECLGRASIPAVSIQWHVQSRQRDLRTSPLWVEPLALSMESYAKTYVDGLAAQGFFDGGRLGILYDEGPTWSAVERDVLEPELRRVHAHVVATAAYQIRGFGDVAPAEPALRSYALMFKEKHVDRVISFEPWEGWGFFMLEANRQQFYPRWGLSSQTDWEVVKATGLVPEKEMLGARFVGWSPVMDIQNMWKPTTKPRWSRLRLCDGIYAQAGIRPDGPLAEVFSLALCDGLLDVAALGAREHGVLDRVSFPRAVSAVAWQSSFFPTTRVSVARPDGVIAVRPASWDAAHSRFVYTGRPGPAAP